MNNYKKMMVAVLGIALMATVSSCRHYGRGRTVISTNNDGSTKRIEYSGQVVFSKDRRSIDYISSGGYVKYERNGRKIEAEGDANGHVAYEYNGDKAATLDADGKQFLAEAVQEISHEQEKAKEARKKGE